MSTHCIDCSAEYPESEIRAKIFNDEIPLCTKCGGYIKVIFCFYFCFCVFFLAVFVFCHKTYRVQTKHTKNKIQNTQKKNL